MIRIGNFEIRSVVTGRYRLDGGAMFGVVPKVLWQKSEEVDDQNRIAMVMRTLLAVDQAAGRVILVDTGAGDDWPAEQAARYAVEPCPAAIRDALADYGLGDDDVTDIVITHMHFDHGGGLMVAGAGDAAGVGSAAPPDPGRSRLRFPNARHWIHQAQWEHTLAPSERDRASFLARNYEALQGADQLWAVEGEPPSPPCDGMEWFVSNGHTPGQLLPIFFDDRCRLLFAGDLIPTSTHLPVAWVMAYDLFPLTTIEEKKRVHRWCAEDGLMLAFPHDRRMGGARVTFPGKRPEAIPIDL